MRYEINAKEIVQALYDNHKNFSAASRATGVSPSYISQIYHGDRDPKHIAETTYNKLLSGLTPAQINALSRHENTAEIGEHEKLAIWIASAPEATKIAVLSICKELGYGKKPRKNNP